MADAYIAEIRSVQPHGPYFLGGFCSGAYIALEMAARLHEQGDEVALLATFNTDGNWKRVGSFAGGIHYHCIHLSQLPLSGKAEYLLRRVRYRLDGRSVRSQSAGLWGTQVPWRIDQ